MPEYFMSNNTAQYDLSSSSVVGSTTAGTFDSAVVDSSILLPAASSGVAPANFWAGMPILVGGPSITTKIFGHFEAFLPSGNFTTTSSSAFFIRIRNNVGLPVFRLNWASSTTLQAEFWNGSSWTSVGPTLSRLSPGLTTFDFDFTPGALGSFSLYINGGTIPILSVSNFNAAVNNIASVDIGNPYEAIMYISQGVLSDVDLRGAKLFSRRPNGNGFYTAGTGTFTDVNSIVKNDLTGIGLPTAGDRKTFTLPTISATGRVIRNVHVNNLCAAAGATPNVRIVTRRLATDATSGNISPAPSTGLTARQTSLPLDLSTGLSWTIANFIATEFGVEGRP